MLRFVLALASSCPFVGVAWGLRLCLAVAAVALGLAALGLFGV